MVMLMDYTFLAVGSLLKMNSQVGMDIYNNGGVSPLHFLLSFTLLLLTWSSVSKSTNRNWPLGRPVERKGKGKPPAGSVGPDLIIQLEGKYPRLSACYDSKVLWLTLSVARQYKSRFSFLLALAGFPCSKTMAGRSFESSGGVWCFSFFLK